MTPIATPCLVQLNLHGQIVRVEPLRFIHLRDVRPLNLKQMEESMSTVAPEHLELVKGLLQSHAAAKVKNLLATIDVHYSARTIEKVLAEMTASGEREPLRGGVGEALPVHIDREAAERGCQKLLAAQIAADQVCWPKRQEWLERHGLAA